MATPLSSLNGHGIPKWAITAVVGVAAIFGAGYALAQRVEQQIAKVDVMDARLCRIETALRIPPWPTCPRPQAPQP